MTLDKKLINFRKASLSDETLVRAWFNKPHVQEFWDNSGDTWRNFKNYIKNQKILIDYWICSYDTQPYGLILTSNAAEPTPEEFPTDSDDLLITHLEPVGVTFTIDFFIGEEDFLGKGFSYRTLEKFAEIQDPSVTGFVISPAKTNTKAIHIYEKYGFMKVGELMVEGSQHIIMAINLGLKQ